MTTVAYKDGILAADTMMVRGGEPAYTARKTFRTAKFLVGMSGDMTNVRAFEDWLKDHEVRIHEDAGEDAGTLHRFWDTAPDFGDGFCAILINELGHIWSCVDGPPVRVHTVYESIGTGAKYAMGAMAMGATAAAAVAVASAHDIHTGGPVIMKRLRDE